MDITRIDFINVDDCHGKVPLVMCNILMDDVLLLKEVKLFCSRTKGYYLVFPSKQDLYGSIKAANRGIDIALPGVNCIEKENVKYDEFFHPVNKNFYESILDSVLGGYHMYLRHGIPRFVYRPMGRRKDNWQEDVKLVTQMED